jgi:hypothetical protein
MQRVYVTGSYTLHSENSIPAFAGTTLELQLSMPEYDASGALRRVPRVVKARIAPGAIDGQRLRLPGGWQGIPWRARWDLYLNRLKALASKNVSPPDFMNH